MVKDDNINGGTGYVSGHLATSEGGDAHSSKDNLVLPNIIPQKQSDNGSKTTRNLNQTAISKTQDNDTANLNLSRIYSDRSNSRIELGIQDSHMLDM